MTMLEALGAAQSITAVITKRQRSLFADDIAKHANHARSVLGSMRVLVIGGAGSIGSATVRVLGELGARDVVVVDQNENQLVELTRDIRSRETPAPALFRTLAVDFGSPIMEAFLRDLGPLDLVLNFAAGKHVRGEKDAYSLLGMLETNLVKADRLLGWLERGGFKGRYFAVSTDKAANPVNLMGASKRAMEQLMFSGACIDPARACSARFANVAFSDGSLLQGFLQRLARRQPLAVPRATRRYFVSQEEAGHICALAALMAPGAGILVPTLDPSQHLVDLESVADATLQHFGLHPHWCTTEEEAKTALSSLTNDRYPVLVTPLDTAGEKAFEEFVGDGESAAALPTLESLECVTAPALPPARVRATVASIAEAVACPPRDKSVPVQLLADLVPELRHAASSKSLDERM